MWKHKHRMDPVFLLSPGRSGSTLLQRYLNCSKDLILWGEHGGFLRGLRNTYQTWYENKNTQAAFQRGNPHAGLLLASKAATGVDIEWTNNFSPNHFKRQLTNLIVELFTVDVPYRTRWGFKEIRYDDKDVIFLRELFPLAQFIFIVRDPIDTLASTIVAFAKGRVLWESTEQTAEAMNKMKEQLETHSARIVGVAKGIVNCVEKDEGYLIRYEELRDNPLESVKRICQYLRCSGPEPEQIKLIAGDVRQGTNTKVVKQRIKQEFFDVACVQDVLSMYKSFGYSQPVP